MKKKSWHISENEVTPVNIFNKRRDFLKLGIASVLTSSYIFESFAQETSKIQTSKVKGDIKKLLFKKDKNLKNLDLNTYKQITSYNNFYEFTTNKERVKKLSHTLNTNNWKIQIDGLVEKPFSIDIESLIKKFTLEERIYRFRCVEGWSMVVPWIGFSLSSLIKLAKPLSKAKYIRFETKFDDEMFPDQARGVFATMDYPYVEALRMDEAMNDLSILALGLYGSLMPNQNGAPIRLIVPWKYGFKSIKSISKISFVEKEPINSWQKANSKEYGFYANVNPNVDHPRWSQKKERVLGKFFKQKTQLFNSYEKEVAHLYKNMDLTKYI